MRLTLLLLVLLTLLLISECRRKPKPKPSKGKKPARPAKPGKKPSGGGGGKPKPPAINYAKWTAEPTGGTCWWNLASKDCAICKKGGMQCGYPLQNKCYKKTSHSGMPRNSRQHCDPFRGRISLLL